VSAELHVRVDTPVVECGGEVVGTVGWTVAGDGHRGLRLELRYRTEGRGDRDSASPVRLALPAQPSGSMPFRLAVPQGGPISYQGKLIRVIWEVALVVDRPLQSDDVEAVPVTVFPRGGLALWAQHHAGPPQ
jgi:hypothetical protein